MWMTASVFGSLLLCHYHPQDCMMLAVQELAWASYSLLRNTNSSGLLVASSSGQVKVIRGTVRQAAGAGKSQSALDDVQKVRRTLPQQF